MITYRKFSNPIGQRRGKKLEQTMSSKTRTLYPFRLSKVDFGALVGLDNVEGCVFVECVKKIISYMGMQACERSDKVPEGKASHALYLAGVYRGGHDVLVRAKMALGGTSSDPGATVITMQLTIRSTDESAVHVIASAVE